MISVTRSRRNKSIEARRNHQIRSIVRDGGSFHQRTNSGFYFALRSKNKRGGRKKIQCTIVRRVGEQCIHDDELRDLLAKKAAIHDDELKDLLAKKVRCASHSLEPLDGRP
ncbi:hypothetical protein ISN45_Aa08g005430 [Arabidopsis thaliana x Arabidopsis arenosa]|uniref:Uncharacterized protein n=1 Tax=Arabidopsis thaliana x Arabidopsis arenosa TaxID=1240361 RepID=A0A8T1XJY1_9BRAS|nr:hypothetical protein ISN45_Aa08g005430 [Arabidopsis thaliana x Arabidopsis arenosa]